MNIFEIKEWRKAALVDTYDRSTKFAMKKASSSSLIMGTARLAFLETPELLELYGIVLLLLPLS